MLKLKSKTFSFSLIWIVASVILFFIGLVLAASSGLTGTKNLGIYLYMIAMVSMLFHVFYSSVLWFRFKKGEALNNLVTAYIILALLFTVGGLIGAFLTFPDGLTTFLIGLGMFGGYWIIKLITVIFSKDSAFE